MSIYADIILDHYQNPRNFIKLKNPTAEVELTNPFCGDRLSMQILSKEGKVADIAFQGEGCAISIASASILTEYAKGKKLAKLAKLSSSDMLALLGIVLTPTRMKCALLGWEGLLKLVKNQNTRI